MRILLVGINYAPDLVGVAKYNTELCENLVAAGHEGQVITAPPYSADRNTRFRKQQRLNQSVTVGLYSGTMSNKQGLDLIIEAAAILERSHPHIQFVLCGNGPHKLRLMAQSSDRPNIHILELQPDEWFSVGGGG